MAMWQWLGGLFAPSQGQASVRFRVRQETGVIVDGPAAVVQTQIISDPAKASIREREGVPLYNLRRAGDRAEWVGVMVQEYGSAVDPRYDSRYWLQDALNLHQGIRLGLAGMEKVWSLSNKHLGMGALVFSIIFALVCLWVAAQPNEVRIVQQEGGNGIADAETESSGSQDQGGGESGAGDGADGPQSGDPGASGNPRLGAGTALTLESDRSREPGGVGGSHS